VPLLLVFVCTSTGALPQDVGKKLQAHGIPETAVSLYVQEVNKDAPVLALNQYVARNPASVMKLLTTLVALEQLGPDYTWRTEAYIDGTLRDGRLDGDLILKGYGDPFLTPERFWQFLRGIRDRGVDEIGGKVIIDGSYLARPPEDRGDFDGKPRRAYNALPYALSLNFQSTHLYLKPDKASGRVRAFTYPPLNNLRLHNELQLVRGPCPKSQRGPEISIAEDATGATLKVSGTYSERCPEFYTAYLLMDPQRHLSGAFEALWRELGGHVQEGFVKSGERPKGAQLFHAMESLPLGETIRGMNKFSNNLMSRLLFLTLGAERYGAPGSPAKGRRAIADWLRTRNLTSRDFFVDNGAGLSRRAHISAHTFGRLLLAAYRSPVMPEFMASLPVAGVDGTMRRRLRSGPLVGRAHIKTGSLNNVSAMAGYVLDRDSRRWAVVLMINHPGVSWQGKVVQDALLSWVYREAGLSSQRDESTADGSDLNLGNKRTSMSGAAAKAKKVLSNRVNDKDSG
jgi:D-alanyl-D-alanine carboxypeptidase/D-alanyl-D-alanine-endopeptidase (penicillin-binding protein 4)